MSEQEVEDSLADGCFGGTMERIRFPTNNGNFDFRMEMVGIRIAAVMTARINPKRGL